MFKRLSRLNSMSLRKTKTNIKKTKQNFQIQNEKPATWSLIDPISEKPNAVLLKTLSRMKNQKSGSNEIHFQLV